MRFRLFGRMEVPAPSDASAEGGPSLSRLGMFPVLSEKIQRFISRVSTAPKLLQSITARNHTRGPRLRTEEAILLFSPSTNYFSLQILSFNNYCSSFCYISRHLIRFLHFLQKELCHRLPALHFDIDTQRPHSPTCSLLASPSLPPSSASP